MRRRMTNDVERRAASKECLTFISCEQQKKERLHRFETKEAQANVQSEKSVKSKRRYVCQCVILVMMKIIAKMMNDDATPDNISLNRINHVDNNSHYNDDGVATEYFSGCCDGQVSP